MSVDASVDPIVSATNDSFQVTRPGEAERITGLKEHERIATTLKQLDSIFDGLRENFERGASKCWMEDEWSRGAWGFVGIGTGKNWLPAQADCCYEDCWSSTQPATERCLQQTNNAHSCRNLE
ncbi:MAG TPA: FAD-dependent oxidoreductase [Pyrinomonadaceae bacterium]|nr:FAD-dependent oxidoreductase [Pyrinomonadaceae bacterium]